MTLSLSTICLQFLTTLAGWEVVTVSHTHFGRMGGHVSVVQELWMPQVPSSVYKTCALLCTSQPTAVDTLCTNYLPQTQRTVRTRTLGSGTTMTTATSPRHQRTTSWLVRLCCTVYSCSCRGSNALLYEGLHVGKLYQKILHITCHFLPRE